MAVDWNYDQAVIDGRGPTLDLANTDCMYNHGTLVPYGGGTPGGTDHLFVLGSTMPTSNSAITALLLFDSTGTAVGTSITTSGVTSGITVTNLAIGVSGDATSLHYFYGTVSGGDVTIYGGAVWYASHSDTPANITISSSGGTPLQIQAGNTVTADTLTVNSGGGEVSLDTGSALTMSGDISLLGGTLGMAGGTGTVTLATKLTLQGTARFYTPGGTTLAIVGSGLLEIKGSSSVVNDTGTVKVNSASVDVTVSGTPTLFTAAGTFLFTSAGDLTVSNAAQFKVAAGGTLTITSVGDIVANNTAELNCTVISGGALTFNDNSTGTGGTVACTTVTLNSPKAVNGMTISNSGSLTGSQTVSSGGGLLVNSAGSGGMQ